MADHSDFEPRSSVLPPARLTLLLLGPPQVMVNGEVVMDQRSPKVLALLAYLAVEAHRPHPRGTLAALFWPDQPQKRAFQDLRQTLSRLRRAISDGEADPPHLLADPQTIQFNPESDFWLDVVAFRRLLADTQRHRHRRLDACLTCLSQLAQACAYYRGDFLTDLYVPDSLAFDEWLLVEREGLRRQACTALHALASADLARGQLERARQCAYPLLSLDPWNEAAQRLLLRALALGEGRNAALQHYQTFREALAHELGVEPEDETLALVEQIQAGPLADMQPRAPDALLPTPATPFVGREAERKQLADYLASQDQRLLTLYGPGGSGKTRLALEIAADQSRLWRDGVWFVPLAELPAAEGLVDALAAALNLQATDGPLEAAQLMDFLRPKELLLILDGFEHLMPPLSPPRDRGGEKGGVGLLQDMLRWAPQLRILITSRARLGLREEWAISLEGLDVPPDTSVTVAEAQTYSAVQLFLHSARQLKPDFTLTPENLPHVVRICRLVAGLPLGIELAAAWVRLFPCRQIADEIERSPDFLHNPGGNPSGRQHSLRATFEYSYNLLSETERVLFRKLSVFRGGFTADAARQVTGSGPSNLASLLDKSLLQISPSRRLDVHLTLRDYAAEKLAQRPEEERETRERHGCIYLFFVQQRESILKGDNPEGALEKIYVELGNVREAWRWAVARARIEEIEASIDGLSRFYDLRGLFREAEVAFGSAADRALALPAETSEVCGRLLAMQARFLIKQAKYEHGIQVAEAAIGLALRRAQDTAQAAQDARTEAVARRWWGEALFRQGDYTAAQVQLEQAVSLARAAGARPVEADSLSLLGGVCWGQGDYAGVGPYLERALLIYRETGDRVRGAKTLNNLGIAAVEQGKYTEASAYYEQALRIMQDIGDREGEGAILNNLGNIWLYLGCYAEAQKHYEQALRALEDIDDQACAANTLGNLGLVHHYLGQHKASREYSQQALRIAQEAGQRPLQAFRLLYLGHACLGLGQLEEAADAYRQALALRRELNQPNLATESLAGLARVALTQGTLTQAQSQVEEILRYLEHGSLDGTEHPFQVYLTCYRVLGANQDPRAQEILTTAYDLLQERAVRIADEELRRSFLENVAAHREIVSHYSGREWV